MLGNILTAREVVLKAIELGGPSTVNELMAHTLVVEQGVKRDYLYRLLGRMEEAGEIERLHTYRPNKFKLVGQSEPETKELISPTLVKFDKPNLEKGLSGLGKDMLGMLQNKTAIPPNGISYKDKVIAPGPLIVFGAKALLLAEDEETIVGFLQDLAQAIQVYDSKESQPKE